ncbi:MAG: ABC-F family ATP-binding cassette domain-containing protein [Candidatus Saccharimonadales bacterium]
MLLSINITEKSFGSNVLYKDLEFDIQDGEKIGLVGRNGTGKSTLLNLMTGEDKDYAGEIVIKNGISVISSRQEHHGFEDKTVLEYIQGDLPEYAHLAHIIDNYPQTMGSNNRLIQEFSNALERFGHLGYYQIEDEIAQAIEAYQLDPLILHRTLGSLSGGQRRMIELIKVQRSRGHLAFIDEPTNHMDYVAKESFIKWLKAAQEAVLVITHDRDVLHNVNRIIEIRDGRSFNFRGNYDDYLRINKNQVGSQVNEYDLTQRRMANLQEDIVRFRRLKERSRTPGTIKRFKASEQKAVDELARLSATEKPAFWIDQESAVGMSRKLTVAYDKYKAKNISIQTHGTAGTTTGAVAKAGSKPAVVEVPTGRRLVKVSKLSLGYDDKPLFSGIDFSLREGERLRLHGRNGAGKTTLVQAIMAQVTGTPLPSKCFAGEVELEPETRVGLYEQEISPKYLKLTLNGAVEQILRDKDRPINPQKVKQLLSNYLFNPQADGDMPVQKLSGGQKARLQLIAMLADDPQMLILDEPTNHLDLPSIEELENALINYHGAIIYISHDSFFAKKLGGQTITIAS